MNTLIRFRRLMDKRDKALAEKRMDDANRYALMAGDIEGFARHPRLKQQIEKL